MQNSDRIKLLDPRNSVWISANAGSGKTKLLVDRILSLILHGVRPNNILAITFTNIAAKEMSDRVMQKIIAWSIMDADLLRDEIISICGDNLTLEELEHSTKYAKNLFHSFLSNDNHLQIQTIHSFCKKLITSFSFEASVPVNFTVMDENEAKELLREAKDLFLQESLDKNKFDLKRAISEIAIEINSDDLLNLIEEALSHKYEMEKVFLYYPEIQEIILQIAKIFQVDYEDSEVKIKQELQNYLVEKEDKLKNIANILVENVGSKRDQSVGDKLLAYLNLSNEERILQLDMYQSIFLTSKGEMKKVSSIVTKAVFANYPEVEDLIISYQHDILAIGDRLNSAKILGYTKYLLEIYQEIAGIYVQLKNNRNVVDYDDLIIKVLELLNSQENSDWILYVLDNKISHILVDEAQDTSPRQWQIIFSIISEYFVGRGGGQDEERNIFVVGDEKQSIFSFQGADINHFAAVKQYLEGKVVAGSASWVNGILNKSYRSTPEILELVDNVFLDKARSGAISKVGSQIVHVANRADERGLVELWPLIHIQEKDGKNILDANLLFPEERKEYLNDEMVAADIIARKIKGWVDSKRIIAGKNRMVKLSDIMILMRNRGRMMGYLTKSLNRYGVSNSGSDKVKLSDHIIAKDLVSLVKFLLFVSDDLNLAALLKSPLFKFSEQDLFHICHKRDDLTIWEFLQTQVDCNIKYQKAVEYLQHLLFLSEDISIMHLFTYVIEILGARRVFNDYVGEVEASNILNAFLDIVRNFSKGGIGNLLSFINYIEGSDIEVKQHKMNNEEEQVRLMTVHGAKGLQAPITIIMDSNNACSTNRNSNRIILAKDVEFKNNFVELPIWYVRSGYMNNVCKVLHAEASANEEEEYMRLLYVALTRAEDELYIIGTGQEVENSWYDVVRGVMSEKYGEKYNQQFIFNSRYLDNPIIADGYKIGDDNNIGDDDIGSLPVEELYVIDDKQVGDVDFCMTVPEQNISITKDLDVNLDAVGKGDELMGSSDDADINDNYYVNRGILVHKLLEILPNIASDVLAKEKAFMIMKSYIPVIPFVEHQSILDMVLAIIHKFPELYKENSMAELQVSALINGKIVNVQIDRLILDDDIVTILDYKTGNVTKKNLEDYKEQMNLYKMVIEKVYPKKKVLLKILCCDQLEMLVL